MFLQVLGWFRLSQSLTIRCDSETVVLCFCKFWPPPPPPPLCPFPPPYPTPSLPSPYIPRSTQSFHFAPNHLPSPPLPAFPCPLPPPPPLGPSPPAPPPPPIPPSPPSSPASPPPSPPSLGPLPYPLTTSLPLPPLSPPSLPPSTHPTSLLFGLCSTHPFSLWFSPIPYYTPWPLLFDLTTPPLLCSSRLPSISLPHIPVFSGQPVYGNIGFKRSDPLKVSKQFHYCFQITTSVDIVNLCYVLWLVVWFQMLKVSCHANTKVNGCLFYVVHL